MKFNRLLFVVAMEEELKDFLLELSVGPGASLSSALSAQFFSGAFLNMEIGIVYTGNAKVLTPRGSTAISLIGSLPAGVASFEAIKKFSPDIVISLGTAGGFKSRGGKIGDFILSREVRFFDRVVDLNGYREFGQMNWQEHGFLDLAMACGFKEGIVISGDSFTSHLKYPEADAVDMEAAAIAWVAKQFQIPFFALKMIANFLDVDEIHAVDEFEQNLPKAGAQVATAAVRLLKCLNQLS